MIRSDVQNDSSKRVSTQAVSQNSCKLRLAVRDVRGAVDEGFYHPPKRQETLGLPTVTNDIGAHAVIETRSGIRKKSSGSGACRTREKRSSYNAGTAYATKTNMPARLPSEPSRGDFVDDQFCEREPRRAREAAAITLLHPRGGSLTTRSVVGTRLC